MNEMKHTPGPWKNTAPIVNGKVDECYRYIEAGPGFLQHHSGTGFCLSGFISPDDAKLIAAAPGLLAALQFMVRWHDQLSPDDIAMAKAAIDCATGGDA